MIIDRSEQWTDVSGDVDVSDDGVGARAWRVLRPSGFVALSGQDRLRAICRGPCADLFGITRDGRRIVRVCPEDERVETVYTMPGKAGQPRFKAISAAGGYVYVAEDENVIRMLPATRPPTEPHLSVSVRFTVVDLAAGPRCLYILGGRAFLYRMDYYDGSIERMGKVPFARADRIALDAAANRLIITHSKYDDEKETYTNRLALFDVSERRTIRVGGLQAPDLCPGDPKDFKLVSAAPDPRGGVLLAYGGRCLARTDGEAEMTAADVTTTSASVVDLCQGPLEGELSALVGTDGKPKSDRYVEVYRPREEFPVETGLRAGATVKTLSLDSGAPGTAWHKVTVDADYPAETKVRVKYHASDSLSEGEGGGENPGEADPAANGDWSEWLENPKSFLPNGTEGRYLRFGLELEWTANASPRVRSLTAEYPRATYLRFLPTIYHKDDSERDFLERYLSIFEDVIGRTEGEIDNADLLAFPERAPPDGLAWLATWLGFAPEPSWTREETLAFIKAAPAYLPRRGTKEGLYTVLRVFLADLAREGVSSQTEIPEAFTTAWRYRGLPIIVEAFQIADLELGEAGRDVLDVYRELFAADEYSFTVLLPGYVGFDLSRRAKLARVVELEKPAHTRACLAYLWPALVLSGHTYLGANTILMSPESVLAEWWVPMASVLAGVPGAGVERESAEPQPLGKAKRKVYHVTYIKKLGWKVKAVDEAEAKFYETKVKAVSAARELALRRKPSQIRIHKRDGKIQEERTYGDDPYPPKG